MEDELIGCGCLILIVIFVVCVIGIPFLLLVYGLNYFMPIPVALALVIGFLILLK